MHDKLAPKVGVVRSRDRNLKFGTPSITFERKKLRTPRFVDEYIAWRPLSKYENLTLKGRGFGHVTIFQILGRLYIFGMTKDRNFIFGALTDHDMH